MLREARKAMEVAKSKIRIGKKKIRKGYVSPHKRRRTK